MFRFISDLQIKQRIQILEGGRGYKELVNVKSRPDITYLFKRLYVIWNVGKYLIFAISKNSQI